MRTGPGIADHVSPAIPALRLMADLKGRFDEDRAAEADWLAEWSRPHLLCVDELAELVGSDYTRATFTMAVNQRYELCRPTLLIGNLDAEQFVECVGASIADRACEGGGYIECDWPSFRGRPGGAR